MFRAFPFSVLVTEHVTSVIPDVTLRRLKWRLGVLLRTYSKLWTIVAVACLAALILGALILPQSFRLTALSDVIQCVLLLSGTLSFLPRALHSRGRLRVFWMLIATGIGFWLSYQVFWTYYEVWLRIEVPDLCAADIIIFLHIVPLMAALALRPHAPPDDYSARLRRLDFALMLVWWIYLYVLIVIPWQYVVADTVNYNRNLNSLYLIEKLAFLGALFIAGMSSKGGWRMFYASLFGACSIYAAGSYIANWALGRNIYYSGSLYDIPLAISMTWITVIGLWTTAREPEAAAPRTTTSHSVWLARLGMITVFSIPLFAAWALWDVTTPTRIRSFRLVLTLVAALLMGVKVFVRQRLLDRELHRLLTQSNESLANLKRLQAQIMESEKLASIGQLVGGAAHELNNPITAMLGYSDILLTTPLNPEQLELAGRIGHQVRRTKSLVASLLSFAKQGPATMAPVDLNTVLRTAIKLSQSQWQANQIELRTELQLDLPPVLGDSNQLLQVCVQTLGNALHAVDEIGNRTLTIATRQHNGIASIEISDAIPGPLTEDEALGNSPPDFDSATPLSGLGLSACQGILQQHRGRILWRQDSDVGTTIRIELPVILPVTEKAPGSVPAGVPVMWQPRPFA
jgi:signal transduction histidine kinase